MKTLQRGTLVSAALVGLLVLGGCASSGSGDMSGTSGSDGSSASNGGGSGSNGSGGTTTTASTTPTGDIAYKSGGVVTATGTQSAAWGRLSAAAICRVRRRWATWSTT